MLECTAEAALSIGSPLVPPPAGPVAVDEADDCDLLGSTPRLAMSCWVWWVETEDTGAVEGILPTGELPTGCRGERGSWRAGLDMSATRLPLDLGVPWQIV